MSPEQARTPKLVDQRTDIWSLGVIMFEFLAGDIPFTGDNAMALLAAAFIDKTPSLRAIRPDLPREMEAVIERCLQKKPADRYQSIADFAEALAPFAERASLPSVTRIQGTIARPVSSIPPPMSVVGGGVTDRRAQADTQLATKLSSAPKGATAETLMDWGKSKDQPKRTRYVALAGGAAGVVVLGVLAWQVMSRPAVPQVAKGEAAAEPALLPTAAPSVNVGPAALGAHKAPTPEVTPSTELPAAPAPSASVPPETRKISAQHKPSSASKAGPADPLDGRR